MGFAFAPGISEMPRDSPNSITRLVSSKRILVLGSSGSGKTSFTLQLSRILQIDAIHLDAHFWKPGWLSTPQEEWREIVAALIEKESWIMDGTYESTLPLRVSAADYLIVLEQSRWTCLWRVIKRKATLNDLRRPDAPPGQKLNLAFLRYVWRYPAVSRPLVLDSIRQYGPDKTLVQLRGSKDTQNFLSQVQQAVRP